MIQDSCQVLLDWAQGQFALIQLQKTVKDDRHWCLGNYPSRGSSQPISRIDHGASFDWLRGCSGPTPHRWLAARDIYHMALPPPLLICCLSCGLAPHHHLVERAGQHGRQALQLISSEGQGPWWYTRGVSAFCLYPCGSGGEKFEKRTFSWDVRLSQARDNTWIQVILRTSDWF